MEEDKTNIFVNAFQRHAGVVEESARSIIPQVQKGAEILLVAVKNKRRLLLCGNGGSAADSQHLAAEWLCRYKGERHPLPAIALTTDTSTLTAIGNDYRFEDIFKRQIEALGGAGDVLVAFTTSGKSPNILAAIKAAKAQGMKTIVLTGEKGRDLADRVDLVIAVPSAETARIQEVHELVYHAWCEYFDVHLFS